MARNKGPNACGFPTVAGKADDHDVFWLGDDQRADELEAQYAVVSPLLRLMLRNAYSVPSLSAKEIVEACNFIDSTPETTPREMCSSCHKFPAIGDTRLCRGHNRYALAMRL